MTSPSISAISLLHIRAFPGQCVMALRFSVQVWLAKHEDDGSLVMTPDGKEGLVGINCLTKIQVGLFSLVVHCKF